MEKNRIETTWHCVCVCPTLYNDFKPYCPNYPDSCGQAMINNIDLARENILKKQGCVVDSDVREGKYKHFIKGMSNQDIDKKLLGSCRNHSEKSYNDFLEFYNKNYPPY